MLKTVLLVTLLAALSAIIVLVVWRVCDARAERIAWDAIAQRRADGLPFDPEMVADLPEPVRRYFLYTIEPGTPLFTTAQIEMTGEIGLGSKEAPGYRPMDAQQILSMPAGFVWRLRSGLITGSDGMTSDGSWTRFRFAGLLPVAHTGGYPDHFRSAFGRLVAEAVFWTPAALLSSSVRWEELSENQVRLSVSFHGLEQTVEVTIDEEGRPRRVVIPRWSNANPEKVWRLQPFGGDLSEFKQFDGYRLPTHVSAGNFIGTEDYFPFFQARITEISFGDAPPID